MAIVVLVSIYLSGIGAALLCDTDFGNLDVKMISIPDKGKRISGLLYRPIDATSQNPLPAVVLVHGISGSKQMMSGIALELARHGLVALAIDLVGHGNSEGVFGGDATDPTLGTLAAVGYLEAQPYVNGSLIGLVGHSLGAGAIRATAVAHENIAASVYIAGGLGSMVAGSAYGVLNSTFPKNLLIAVGKYDVLFEMDQLKRAIEPVFEGPQEIAPCFLYGNFSTQTARKLITPPTTHLFEPMDPSIVSEIVLWMNNALRTTGSRPGPFLSIEPNYVYREAAIFVSLVSFVGLIFSISSVIFDLYPPLVQKAKTETNYGILEVWKTLIIWGSLGLVLLLPMFLVGSLIPIPPLIFGSSFAWWLLAVAIVGLLLILLALPKISTVRLTLRPAVSKSLNHMSVVTAVGIFVLLYSITYLVENVSLMDLRMFVIPVFNNLVPVTRIPMFLVFVPFFGVYFFVEGLYFHEFHTSSGQKSGLKSQAVELMKTIGAKIFPYAALLGVNYFPTVWLNIRPLPTFIGFLVEFFWGVMPLFIISIACSWWFYRKTSNIGTGAILNALLFAWSAAATFPFGAFSFSMRF